MMTFLNCDVNSLKSSGGYYTAKEISSQPRLWMETYLKLVNEKDPILSFMSSVYKEENLDVILTGAGTSAFIGEALSGAYKRKLNTNVRAIPTTEIITHPDNYFFKTKPTLLISFARSGDSPESLETVLLAENYCANLYKLNITCNKDGGLAISSFGEKSLVFLLPEETNDISLAMTSSFTSMLLAGFLILNIDRIETYAPLLDQLKNCGNFILETFTGDLREVAESNFERMVFLGSGSMLGVAHESHLKAQELTDGHVICTYNSFLGFRHGPRAVVNDKTILVYLLSNDVHVKKYEYDLIKAIAKNSSGAKYIAIGSNFDTKDLGIDIPVKLPSYIDNIPEELLAVLYVVPAQLIGFYKSMSLGLSPDSPSNSGSISRVVQGVTIYR